MAVRRTVRTLRLLLLLLLMLRRGRRRSLLDEGGGRLGQHLARCGRGHWVSGRVRGHLVLSRGTSVRVINGGRSLWVVGDCDEHLLQGNAPRKVPRPRVVVLHCVFTSHWPTKQATESID